MKKVFVFLVLIGFAAVLGAQSLADVARLEKERRKSLGDRRAPVITNRDLFRVKKRNAVEVVIPPNETVEASETVGTEEGLAVEAETKPESGEPAPTAAAPVTTPPPVQEVAPVPVEPPAETPPPGPTLQEQLQAAEELVDLLETKIAALKQDYSYQSNMVPNYVIERQLTEALDRLKNAQTEVVRLKREIDRKGREKRPPAEAGR